MITRNGIPFDPYQSFVDENNVQHPSGWYFSATPEQRAVLNFSEIPDTVIPQYDERFFILNKDSLTLLQKPINVCRDVISGDVASIRWSHEMRGVVYQGNTYDTQTQSRVNYLGALQKALNDNSYTIVWKTYKILADNVDPATYAPEPVFVTLSAQDIVTIANGVINYVSQCFEYENSIYQRINTATSITDLTAIDVNVGWPSNVIG